jgi:Rad3-related DNA helicase
MWSLHEKKGENEPVILEPLKFSNGKSQQDIVLEVLKAIEEGNKIIFIHGKCGTGKSAIALNLAKELGRASIVVPSKSLQKQYEEDYTNKKYLLKQDKRKLKIKVITGRQNHKCPFLQEEDIEIEGKNATLNNFDSKPKSFEPDESCDNAFLPCKIEIKNENAKTIYNYLKKDPEQDINQDIRHVSRSTLAPICPYWSPIWPLIMELNLKAKKRIYEGLCNNKYAIYQRKEGCGYYNQFISYLDADVLIFNSEKYKIETAMNRKPATDIEIIDECDEFLDKLSNSEAINLNKLYFALGNLFTSDEKLNKILQEITNITKSFLNNPKIDGLIEKEEIIKLKETKLLNLLSYFSNLNFLDHVECDEENYCRHVDEVARTFQHFSDETYLAFSIEDKNVIARLVTINLEKRFSEFIEKNKILVLMSGTIHSDKVLKNIFGLNNFKIIEAEAKMPGKVIKQRIGQEFSCRYENFQKGFASRVRYLKALEKCILSAKPPVLVHVIAFKDLPTEHEAKIYNLNIMTQENLKSLQKKDKIGRAIQDFKGGRIQILYSTKCHRGVDFPGETCNSIILTRYPYPNVSSLFWRILKMEKPEHYYELYMDKANREFLQRVYRALRSPDDQVYLLSPDIRVLMGKI